MAKRRNDMDKDAFICAAEKLITEQGANDFSLADLSKEMGISKGTLYYHYPTKDELILDIMEKHMDGLSKDYVDWLARHKDDKISKQRFLDVIFYKGVKLFNKSKMHIYLINECMSRLTRSVPSTRSAAPRSSPSSPACPTVFRRWSRTCLPPCIKRLCQS